MQGTLSGFGTYTIDGNTVSIAWEASSYPNRAGTTEKRIFKVTGDEMSSVNPAGGTGGVSYGKWVRAK